MIVALLLSLNFSLNLILHRDISVGVLNTLLLFLSVYFYLNFSAQKLRDVKSPYLILLGGIPLFTYHFDLFILSLAVGAALLLVGNTVIRFKIPLIVAIFAYFTLASLYMNGTLKLPFIFSGELLIFFDDKAAPYIPLMQKQALYLPHKIRDLVFGDLVYLSVMLSKAAGLFTLKNLYDVLLVANLYPLTQGLISDLKTWNKSKTIIITVILLVSLLSSLSRGVHIFNVFIILSPFFLYFILRGFSSINKTVYVILFILSLIIAASPTV